MRALVLREAGGPAALRLEGDWLEPEEMDGFVKVDVDAAGVGFVDLLITKGEYQIKPDLPFVPGTEVVGHRRDTGERVIASTMFGAYAETALAPSFTVFPIPDSLPDEQAAGFVINYQTAHLALVKRGRLAPGETVLVHGASGGVGVACIQVAKAIGAGSVIAVASTDAKRAAALEAGADHAVDGSGEWIASVRELTGGRGADVVVDPVGGDAFDGSLKCTAPFGRLLVIGFAGGRIPEVKVNRLLLRHHDVIGVNWGGLLPIDQQFAADAHTDLMAWFEAGLLNPPGGPIFDLEHGADALRFFEDRDSIGKPVITVR
ncbi:MAG: NADPH:quinone oxidoreductase family protein [Actinomycetes bacterium]